METKFPVQEFRWKLGFHKRCDRVAVFRDFVPISKLGMLGCAKIGIALNVSEFRIALGMAPGRGSGVQRVNRRYAEEYRQAPRKEPREEAAARTVHRIFANVRRFGKVETRFPRQQRMETRFPRET